MRAYDEAFNAEERCAFLLMCLFTEDLICQLCVRLICWCWFVSFVPLSLIFAISGVVESIHLHLQKHFPGIAVDNWMKSTSDYCTV